MSILKRKTEGFFFERTAVVLNAMLHVAVQVFRCVGEIDVVVVHRVLGKGIRRLRLPEARDSGNRARNVQPSARAAATLYGATAGQKMRISRKNRLARRAPRQGGD